MRDTLIQILKGAGPAKITVPERRRVAQSLGIELGVIMIANADRAEAQADAIIAGVARASEANKQELATGVPQLAFLLQAPAAAAEPETKKRNTRAATTTTATTTQATTVAREDTQVLPVTEGATLRLEQLELRLGRMEEAMGISHERTTQLLVNLEALAAVMLYSLQTQGLTAATTVKDLATEVGATYMPLVGG